MQLKRGCSGAWIAVLAAVVDQVSKAVVRGLAAHRSTLLSSVDAWRLWQLPGVAAIRVTENTGMAFSLLSGSTALLTVFSTLLIGALVGWLVARPQSQSRLLRAGLWLIVGGGLGNLYDRFVYGRVTDFIELLFMRFAIFNLADAFICIGAFIAALALLRDERKKELPHA